MITDMPRLPGRPPVKQDEIVSSLRRRIVRGELDAGDQLPKRESIEQSFEASRGTVQRAMDTLVRDGFVVANGRRGTFVADHPPHLHHYGVMMPQDPRDPSLRQTGWAGSHFLLALDEQAHILDRPSDQRITVYHAQPKNNQGADLDRLIEDVRSRRLAGLIAVAPYDLWSPEWKDPEFLGGMSLVGLGPRASMPGGVTVGMPQKQMIARGLQRIKEQGARRVSILFSGPMESESAELIPSLVREAGLEMRARWFHGTGPAHAAWTANIIEMVFSSPPEDRPDALFVTDDTLTEHALIGLLRLGLQPGEDIHVLSHCNFPWPPFAVKPVERIGVDVHLLLKTCIELINRQRRGIKVPENVDLAPVFEHELGADEPADVIQLE